MSFSASPLLPLIPGVLQCCLTRNHWGWLRDISSKCKGGGCKTWKWMMTLVQRILLGTGHQRIHCFTKPVPWGQHLPLILSSTYSQMCSALTAVWHTSVWPGHSVQHSQHLQGNCAAATSALTCTSGDNERFPLHLRGSEVKWLSHGFVKEDFAAAACYQVTWVHCFLRGWPQHRQKIRLTWQTPTSALLS